MKQAIFIFSLILSLSLGAKAFSAPVYTDEVPQDYINKVKARKPLNLQQNLPVYDIEKSIEVKVHSEGNIIIKVLPRREDFHYAYDVTYPRINQQLTFIVAEDVYKNNKLFIKKGTPAKGLVREMSYSAPGYGATPEIQVSMFKTKDVNNVNIELYGTVREENSGFLNTPPNISKNKVYTLYYK